jgi:type II secretion system (T2SS) protein E
MTNAAVEGSSETRRTALGTLLIERGMLDEDRLQEALEISDENGERLGEVLVRLSWVSEEDLAKVLAEQWQLRYCDRSSISFDGEALRRMSREDAARLEALPIQVDHEGVLVVALAEPTESRLIALRTLLGDNIDFVVVAKGAIEAGLRSDLLQKAGGGQFDSFAGNASDGGEAFEAAEERAPDFPEPERSWETQSSPGSSSFDEVARALGESVQAHVESLRALLDEAERRRESDRREIDRLQAELTARETELGERDEALSSTQHLLRDLADRLVPRQPE